MKIDRRTVLMALGGTLAWNGAARAIGETLAGATPAPGPVAKPMNIQIAEFVHRVRFEDIPASVVERAKAQLVYHLGLAFSGISMQESIQARTVLTPLATVPGATLIGTNLRVPVSEAAFYNTTLMRAIWRDDVTWPTGIHGGILTYPPALAIAEARRLSGRDLIVAVVLGYEVMCKLARATYALTAAMPRRPTMIYGGYGPITAVGRLTGLDVGRLANAYGYAPNVAMGAPQGGQTTHFYGLLCRNATLSAQLADVGGAPYSPFTLEGAAGLYQSFFGSLPQNLPSLIESLGSQWEILTAEQKRFPGTGENTVAIETFMALIREEHLKPDDVARIDVTTGFFADSTDRKAELSSLGPFNNWVDAWASLPYALAVALIVGDFNPQSYQENLSDPRFVATMHLVKLHTERGHDVPRYSRIEVTTRDGRRLVRENSNVVYPFPRTDWGPWLARDGASVLSAAKLTALEQMIVDLEHLSDVGALMALLGTPKCTA
jgi:2-methylcitrate dehydratase PrpD